MGHTFDGQLDLGACHFPFESFHEVQEKGFFLDLQSAILLKIPFISAED